MICWNTHTCLSAALIGSAGHITGPLGSLQENFLCEYTRESAAAQSVLALPDSQTEVIWAAQLLVLLDYSVDVQDNTIF